MKRINYIALFVALFVSSHTHAQFFNELNGPFGGVQNYVTHPNGNMIAVTNNGVFVSTNNGATWTRSALQDRNFAGIDLSGTTVTIKGLQQIYTSTNGGTSWSAGVATGSVSIADQLKRSPNGTLFNLSSNEIYRSINGAQFTLVKSIDFTNGDEFTDIVFTSDNYMYASSTLGVWQSTNGGTTWTLQNTGLSSTRVRSITSHAGASLGDPDVLYALTELGPVKATSSPLGPVWSSVKNNLIPTIYEGKIEVDPSYNVYLLDDREHKIHLSSNGGASWSGFIPYPINQDVTAAYFSSQANFSMSILGLGIYRTANSGGTWSSVQQGITGFSGNDIHITPSGRLIVSYNPGLGYGQTGSQGLFISADDGQTWIHSVSGTTKTNIRGFLDLADNSILAWGLTDILRTTNDGTQWINQSTGNFFSQVVSYDGVNLYALDEAADRLYKSVDKGVNWTNLGNLTGVQSVIDMEVGPNEIYFFSSMTQKVYKSSIASPLNATELNVPGSVSTPRLPVVKGNKIYMLTPSNANLGVLSVSSDQGTTWTTRDAAASGKLFVYDDDNLFIAANQPGKIFRSNNGGLSWITTELPYSSSNMNDITVSPDSYVYATGYGTPVLKSKIIGIPPKAPSDLVLAGRTFNGIMVKWTDHADNEEAFTLEKSVGNNQNFQPTGVTSTQNSIQGMFAQLDVGVVPGTTYFYRVNAYNAAGKSTYSNELQVTSLNQCAEEIPDNRSWTATSVETAGGTGATDTDNNLLVRKLGNNTYYIYNIPLSGSNTTFDETCGQTMYGISDGSTIPNGNGTWDNTTKTIVLKWEWDPVYGALQQVTTTLTLNPTVPVPEASGLKTYLFSSTEVLLNWEIKGFEDNFIIERSNSLNTGYTTIKTVAYPANTYLDNDPALILGQTYYYRIHSTNATGSSPVSTSAPLLLKNTLFRPFINVVNENFENAQGASWGDLNNDGKEDIFMPSFLDRVGQMVPPVVYLAEGNGQFTRANIPILEEEITLSRGSIIADFNNDGNNDVYIARSGGEEDLFLINNGNMSFSKKKILQTTTLNATRSAAATDFDKDKLLDVFSGDANTPSTKGFLLRNIGNDSFVPVTTAGSLSTDVAFTSDVSWADFDNDNDQDLLILNIDGGPNKLYRNDGGGSFTLLTGLIFDTDIMARARTSSWGDIDNDGDLDLYIGGNDAPSKDRLYFNNGDGTFTSNTTSPVAEAGTRTYGSVFADIDNDEDLDLIASNDAANSIFINNGTGVFTKYAEEEMINHPEIYELGVSTADVDGDGFLDVFPVKGITSEIDLPNYIYRNASTPSASKNWIRIQLTGTASNRSAIGARVKIHYAGSPGKNQIREVQSRTGYGNHSSLIQHFGLGPYTTIDEIEITWPIGAKTILKNVATNQVLKVTQDYAGPVPQTFSPANASTAVSVTPTLEVTFDEKPIPVAGKNLAITLLDAAGSPTSTKQNIAVTSGTITGNKISFTVPGANALINHRKYAVTIDDKAFKDIYGNESAAYTSGWSFTTADNSAPTFAAVTFDNPVVKGFGSRTVVAEITDDESVTSVVMSYRGDGTSGAYTELAGVLNANTSKWEFVVSESVYSATGLEFFITAKDPENNASRSPVSGNHKSLFETIAPVITFTNEATIAKTFTTKTFTATITDNFGVSSATLFHHDTKSGTTTFTSVTGTAVNNVYSFAVPIAAFNSDGLQYYITALDASGNTGRSPATGTHTMMLDNAAPTFTATAATFPSTIDKGTTPKLDVTVSDNLGVDVVTLHYRGLSANAYTTKDGTLVSGKYEFSLPNAADDNGLEFYYTAKDASGNEGRLPATGSQKSFTKVTGPANIPEGILGFGGQEDDWKIFAIPFKLDNNTVTSVLDELGSTNGNKDWKLLTYKDAVAWGEYPTDFATLNRGQGYFINIAGERQVSIGDNLPAPDNHQGNLFKIKLNAGWNQIGNPYLSEILWANAVTLNNLTGTATKLKTFSNGSYIDATGLKPYEGGFVFAETAVEISIPFKGQTVLGGRKRETEITDTDLSGERWKTPIVLEQGKTKNTFTAIGMHPEASPSGDDFDNINGPKFFRFLEMNSNHPEHVAKRFSSDIVPTQDRYTWSFDASSNGEGIVTMRWDNTVFGDNDKELILFDEALQEIVNMRERNTYEFDPKRSQHFKIYFGHDLEIRPTRTVLKAYPNPSHGQTTITFSIADNKPVSTIALVVYDMMGTKVATLKEGNVRPGFYSTEWTAGDNVASGLYLYRLIVSGEKGNEVYTEKIILNK